MIIIAVYAAVAISNYTEYMRALLLIAFIAILLVIPARCFKAKLCIMKIITTVISTSIVLYALMPLGAEGVLGHVPVSNIIHTATRNRDIPWSVWRNQQLESAFLGRGASDFLDNIENAVEQHNIQYIGLKYERGAGDFPVFPVLSRFINSCVQIHYINPSVTMLGSEVESTPKAVIVAGQSLPFAFNGENYMPIYSSYGYMFTFFLNERLALYHKQFTSILDIYNFLSTHNGAFTEEGLMSDGREGFLLFGPYIELERGTYEVAITLTLHNSTYDRLAVIDSVAEFGIDTFFSYYVYSNDFEYRTQTFTIPFTIEEKASNFEIRLQTKEGSYITLNQIELRKLLIEGV